jgi:hypothetical protein
LQRSGSLGCDSPASCGCRPDAGAVCRRRNHRIRLIFAPCRRRRSGGRASPRQPQARRRSEYRYHANFDRAWPIGLRTRGPCSCGRAAAVGLKRSPDPVPPIAGTPGGRRLVLLASFVPRQAWRPSRPISANYGESRPGESGQRARDACSAAWGAGASLQRWYLATSGRSEAHLIGDAPQVLTGSPP